MSLVTYQSKLNHVEAMDELEISAAIEHVAWFAVMVASINQLKVALLIW